MVFNVFFNRTIWYFLQDHHHDITEILLKVALNTSLFKIVFLYLPEIQNGWQNRTYYNIRPNEKNCIYFYFLKNAWKCLLSSITKHTHVITASTTFLYCFIKASFSSYHQHQIEIWIYCCHYFEGRFFRLLWYLQTFLTMCCFIWNMYPIPTLFNPTE